MKHLIVGAGATFAEALALGNPPETCPPLIKNFARVTWDNYSPHPVLEAYLRERLRLTDLGDDPRQLFFRLEEENQTNIEQFMEYAWENRQREWNVDTSDPVPAGYTSGLRLRTHGSPETSIPSWSSQFWEDFLYHGIGSPIAFLMLQCFFENGSGWKDLALSKRLAAKLYEGDLVLNLNYDTVFELALMQSGQPFVYSPNTPRQRDILVCKPHGSLNLAWISTEG